MCGIVGLISQSEVNQNIYDALIALQHRGQDAAGMMTCQAGRFSLHKANGLVRDVFDTSHMLRLKGTMGLGHVRYPTAGTDNHEEAQPFYVNSPYGIALVHNGNLTNTVELARDVFESDLRHLNTQSDSEVLLNVLAHELQSFHQLILKPDTIFKAMESVYKRCKGAYSVVAMISGYGLLAFRDPFGIRPLIYGRRKTDLGFDYMVASESVVLDALGFEILGDVAAGEVIYIDLKGEVHRSICHPDPQLTPCIFEFVYLARPDSVMDGISVHKVRLKMGEKLGQKILKEFPDHDIDVVIPITDTSRTAALPLAKQLGVKYREGFVKNRYIGRTFIMPNQAKRGKSVRQKLNAIPLEFKDKNVLLVDDSIVRGTTCKEIIQMARAAGAKKVYFASAAPPVRYPNVYGIDMPRASDLIAHDQNVEEICKQIGADWLIFQDVEVLGDAAREGNPTITQFEESVFTGRYITGDIDTAYLKRLEKSRIC